MSDCCGCGTSMAPQSLGLSREVSHEGRGLCGVCYDTAYHAGRHHDFPRRTWSRDDLMDEWELLRSENYTRAQAADRLGVSRAAFDRAIWRAKAAGDPRAVPGVAGGVYANTKAAVERAREAVRAATEPAAFAAAPTSHSRELEHAR